MGTKLYDDPEGEAHIWKVREAGLGATAFIPGKPDTHEGWEDSAVPPERLGEYLRELKKLADRYGYESALYGHYGQGCVHARWNFDLATVEGIATWRRFLDDAADLVLSLGGSLSGEHGDGQSRAELLPKMFGDELVEAFREFKAIWDPDWTDEPGQGRRPLPDRLEPPPQPRLQAAAARRRTSPTRTTAAASRTRPPAASAIGNCRRTEGGVMCPSYMVTREEKHSTRGRAHLLWEMLNGEELELLALRRGARRARPLPLVQGLHERLPRSRRHADPQGRVPLPPLRAAGAAAARLRVRADRPLGPARLARTRAREPPHAGAGDERPWREPRPASRRTGSCRGSRRTTFRSCFDGAAACPGGPRGDPVGRHVHEPLRARRSESAAVDVLAAAGFHVSLPRAGLCCGRPLYDYGFLGLARRYLERILDALRDEIRQGIPVVGLEPSCVAVFRDELTKLLPNDEDARRLSQQTFHLAEFLGREQTGWSPPRLDGRVLLHGHCHGRATGAFDAERSLLERMGAEVDAPETGCCGMAGAWGYEKAHFDVSRACAERVLLPAVRDADPTTLLVASGFSCRSQIAQLGPGRHAIHIAEALAHVARTDETDPTLRGRTRRCGGPTPARDGSALSRRRSRRCRRRSRSFRLTCSATTRSSPTANAGFSSGRAAISPGCAFRTGTAPRSSPA